MILAAAAGLERRSSLLASYAAGLARLTERGLAEVAIERGRALARVDATIRAVVQQSFDKQFVRNWLTGPDSGWDRHGDKPPPPLPADIVEATRARYIEAYERISGLSFDAWIGA